MELHLHAIELAKIKEAPARDRYPSLIHEDTFSEAQPLLSLRNLAQLMNYVNVNNHTTVQENTGENTNNLIGKETSRRTKSIIPRFSRSLSGIRLSCLNYFFFTINLDKYMSH